MDDALREKAREARDAIRSGALRGSPLISVVQSIPYRDRDAWVDEVLGIDSEPEDLPGLPAGSVPYLPCSVDCILEVALEAPVRGDDVFVDLGSGLGRVTTLIHLFTGARAIGVELQPPLTAQARAIASRLGLGLDRLSYLDGDAARVEVPEGTVFFDYASFGRDVLGSVLGRIERLARQRPIVFCAVGFDAPALDWLQPRASSSSELVFYDSRNRALDFPLC